MIHKALTLSQRAFIRSVLERDPEAVPVMLANKIIDAGLCRYHQDRDVLIKQTRDYIEVMVAKPSRKSDHLSKNIA